MTNSTHLSMSVLSRRLLARHETASLEANLARKKAYDSAYKLLNVLRLEYVELSSFPLCASYCRKKFKEESIPRVAIQLKPISNEELDGITIAIVDCLKPFPIMLKLVFEQIKDIKVSTMTGEHEYVKTLKQALVEVLFCGFDKLMNFKQRVERVAAKYQGPIKKKNEWIQTQIDTNLPYLRHELRTTFIRPFIEQGIVTRGDVYMILDKLFVDLNEISLYCVFELLDNFGRYLEYGEVSALSFDSSKDKKNLTLNPKLSPYFSKLSTVIGENRSSSHLSSDMVNMIQCLIIYRDVKWNRTSLLKRTSRGKKL